MFFYPRFTVSCRWERVVECLFYNIYTIHYADAVHRSVFILFHITYTRYMVTHTIFVCESNSLLTFAHVPKKTFSIRLHYRMTKETLDNTINFHKNISGCASIFRRQNEREKVLVDSDLKFSPISVIVKILFHCNLYFPMK